MNTLVREHQVKVDAMQRLLQNYRKMGKAKFSAASAEGRLQSLREHWSRVQDLHLELELKATPEERKSLDYFAQEKFLAAEEAFWEAHDFFVDVIATTHDTAAAARTSGDTDGRLEEAAHVRLPHIALPTFSGTYTDWPSFAELFETLVISNTSLTDVQRLYYLKGSLSGPALAIIAQLPSTAANFAPAWDTLKRRYHVPRLLVGAFLGAFLNRPALADDSVAELAGLRDQTNQSLAALRNLGRPTASWDDVLVFLLTKKLPRTLLKDWELAIGARIDMPTYAELDAFLESRIRSREAFETAASEPPRTRAPAQHVHVASPRAPATPSEGDRCPLCRANHALYRCPAFNALRCENRREVVVQHRRCFNCLRQGHSVQHCPSATNCTHCGQRHHSRLHLPAGEARHSGQIVSERPREKSQPTREPVQALTCRPAAPAPRAAVLLATAIVRVRAADGTRVSVRALLDQGSEATFVSESLAQTLRLRKQRSVVEIAGAGDTRVGTSRACVQLTLFPSRACAGSEVSTRALVLPRLSGYRGSERVANVQDYGHLRHLPLADPHPPQQLPIDVLLGADVYGQLLRPGLRRGRPSEPIAQRTIFGWVVSGPTARPARTFPVSYHTRVVSNEQLSRQLQAFWDIEEGPLDTSLTPEDAACEQQFRDTVRRRADGRFIVRLPFRDPPSVALGESRPRAVAVLQGLQRRFRRDSPLAAAYATFIREYEEMGHMTEVPPSHLARPRTYLPHHPVLHRSDGEITKIRVVFNASCPTSNGRSLNDCLRVGPKLQAQIQTTLLRWRLPRIALKADIKKMYRQIAVHPEDSPHQTILWQSSPRGPVQTYELTTVSYGMSAAPFLAQRVLRQVATEEETRFPRGAQIVRDHFYVDDVLFGADDDHEALARRDELIALLATGGFELGKWASTQPNLVPDEALEAHAVPPPSSFQEEERQPVLGVQWLPSSDAFSYVPAVPNDAPSTKRAILSTAARIFDPLGWVAPVVVVAKILVQELWALDLGWDDPIPPTANAVWTRFLEELPRLRAIRVPRWCGWRPPGTGIQLHGFADASARAYAAVVYLRVPNLDGRTFRVSLMTAKTKVAPVKTLSIPRLELCAAVLLSRLLRRVTADLALPVAASRAWSDSQIVLAWIRRHPSTWRVFVANRVAEIQSALPAARWSHVRTADNPADCASRGIMPANLETNSLWWEGPSWLRQPEESWPPFADLPSPLPEEEVRRTALHAAVAVQPSPLDPLPNSVSSWSRLLRVTRLVLHAVDRMRKRDLAPNLDGWRAAPARRGRLLWLRWLQLGAFETERQALLAGNPVRASSPLHRLDPFIDEDGLIRVGGRLRHAPIPFEQRHPLVLPPHRLSELLVANVHLQTLHGGPLLTESVLRQRYWLLRGRQTVRAVVHRCTICARHRAAAATQKMADLPCERVTPSRPFARTGVDYAGPIAVRFGKGRGHRSTKAYIALFVCFSTKAIHLEAVSDYTSASFLAALQRFVARRGSPGEMYSDHGTTFRGAARELHRITQAAVASPEVSAYLHRHETKWAFIPPSAPHFGGLWEAGVKSAKHHLRRVMQGHLLTFEELTTLLCSVEACLNSRPLAPLSTEDPYDTALTPNHFLSGAPLLSTGQPGPTSDATTLLTRWQLVNRMRDHFWKRWRLEYLNTLQQRGKWTRTQPNLQPGDIVIVREDNVPPAQWCLGRVVAVHPGVDQQVRVADVQVQTGVWTRPIAKLVRLPAEPAV